MTLAARLFLKNAFRPDRRYQTSALVFCFAFGLAMIANAMGTADGTWFWYAVLFRHGERLYSQLHLVQQPLFIVDTAWFMALMGKGWLVSKFFAVLNVGLYAFSFFALVQYVPMSDRRKAILLGAAFFAAINSVGYRLDDYHILEELLVVYSLVLLVQLHRGLEPKRELALTALLGVFAALCFETRSVNGAALFLGSAIAILCFVRKRPWSSLALFSVAAMMTALFVVRLTGDSFHDYWLNSFEKAANSKGGTAGVLHSALLLPLNTARFLRVVDRQYLAVVCYFVLVCLIWTYVLEPALRREMEKPLLAGILGSVLILAPLYWLYCHRLPEGQDMLSIATIGTFLLYGLSMLAFARLLVWIIAPSLFTGEWNRLEVLLFIPLGQLVAEGMSSGGLHGEFYAPMAMLIPLLPMASPIRLRRRGQSLLVAAASLLLCCGVAHRAMVPYRWLNFSSQPLFVDREWFSHPIYGPMYIERDLHSFIERVCNLVDADGSHAELLSIPYPFANYFCDVPPWHDYVQTWYDTSSKATIDGLLAELQQAPPKWILYERQPGVLRLHEVIYQGGQPLPHRLLDQLIEQKTGSGSWKVVYKSTYGSALYFPQELLLIQTRP